jgi:hypothetical protein
LLDGQEGKEEQEEEKAKGSKGQKIEASSSPTRELDLLKFEPHPWFVSMNLWLTNMIMTLNPLHVELK